MIFIVSLAVPLLTCLAGTKFIKIFDVTCLAEEESLFAMPVTFACM